MQYILMNKDESWASFSCVQDEFGRGSAVLNEWYTDLRPLGLQSLTAWLEKRKAPKHRKHIEPLLERYGCVGLEGFLRVTHALSLNDTFGSKMRPKRSAVTRFPYIGTSLMPSSRRRLSAA